MSITDVAKAAGVSTATVSRVLNELPGVKDDTIRQVKAAVEALNYRPLRIRKSSKGSAGHGRGGKTGNIALITLGQTRDWLQLPVMASVVQGIQVAAAEQNLRLMLEELPDPNNLSPIFRSDKIDGAIVFRTSSLPIVSQAKVLENLTAQVPIVWVMGIEVTVSGVDHVTANNLSIGTLAHSYLVSKGCKKPAFLTATPGWAFIRVRGQGFLNAVYDAGQRGESYVVSETKQSWDCYGSSVTSAGNLNDLVEKLAKSKNRPDGLFVANDATTVQLYPLLEKHGISPGKDLVILSCDNEEIRLSALSPRPASIDIGAEQIGYRAVVRLLARVERPKDLPLVIQISPRIIEPA